MRVVPPLAVAVLPGVGFGVPGVSRRRAAARHVEPGASERHRHGGLRRTGTGRLRPHRAAGGGPRRGCRRLSGSGERGGGTARLPRIALACGGVVPSRRGLGPALLVSARCASRALGDGVRHPPGHRLSPRGRRDRSGERRPVAALGNRYRGAGKAGGNCGCCRSTSSRGAGGRSRTGMAGARRPARCFAVRLPISRPGPTHGGPRAWGSSSWETSTVVWQCPGIGRGGFCRRPARCFTCRPWGWWPDATLVSRSLSTIWSSAAGLRRCSFPVRFMRWRGTATIPTIARCGPTFPWEASPALQPRRWADRARRAQRCPGSWFRPSGRERAAPTLANPSMAPESSLPGSSSAARLPSRRLPYPRWRLAVTARWAHYPRGHSPLEGSSRMRMTIPTARPERKRFDSCALLQANDPRDGLNGLSPANRVNRPL